MKRICFIGTCLLILIGAIAFGWTGLFPGQSVDLMTEINKENSVYYSGYLVRANGLGAVTVFEIDIDAKPQCVAAW